MAKGWFKIKKDSPTGEKLTKVFDRVDAFHTEYLKFREQYNIKAIQFSSYYLADIEKVTFQDEANKEGWIPASKKSKYYVPIKGTQARKDFLELKKMAVERAEIDVALGAPSLFPEAGYDARFKDWYFIHFGQGSTYKLSEDCEPISDEEYRKAERSGEFNG